MLYIWLNTANRHTAQISWYIREISFFSAYWITRTSRCLRRRTSEQIAKSTNASTSFSVSIYRIPRGMQTLRFFSFYTLGRTYFPFLFSSHTRFVLTFYYLKMILCQHETQATESSWSGCGRKIRSRPTIPLYFASMCSLSVLYFSLFSINFLVLLASSSLTIFSFLFDASMKLQTNMTINTKRNKVFFRKYLSLIRTHLSISSISSSNWYKTVKRCFFMFNIINMKRVFIRSTLKQIDYCKIFSGNPEI